MDWIKLRSGSDVRGTAVGEGQVLTGAEESYTSHNTKLLDVDGVVKKILTTDYVQEQLGNLK